MSGVNKSAGKDQTNKSCHPIPFSCRIRNQWHQVKRVEKASGGLGGIEVPVSMICRKDLDNNK